LRGAGAKKKIAKGHSQNKKLKELENPEPNLKKTRWLQRGGTGLRGKARSQQVSENDGRENVENKGLKKADCQKRKVPSLERKRGCDR